jgi:hypothetical protein
MNAAAKKAIFDFPLSPGRQALHDHLGSVATARAAADHAAVPVGRLRDRLQTANDELAAAEAALATIDTGRAAAMRAAAETGGEIEILDGPARGKAAAAVEAARRAVAALQSALDNCTADEATARRTVHYLTATTDAYLLAVITEEFSAALEDYAAVRDELVVAETKVCALCELFGEHGRGLHAAGLDRGIDWLRAGERARLAWNGTPAPETKPAAVTSVFARWRVVLAQLANDATATG